MIPGFLDFVHSLVFQKKTQKNTTFRKQTQFPKRCVVLCFLYYRTVDKV
jgi:hypothetical protein